MRARELMLLAGAFAIVAVFGCDRITGTRPPAKPCATDTTYYVTIVNRIGRVDSLQVTQTIDRCGRL